ncbi:MAG: response regulator transcription factor [Lachnospiraceae bacterium]|jgi:DNA-binding response OmpR family regulator|nr:response regulator transcription factor [Lachnospiraceae bacterium]
MANILIVEDEKNMQDIICEYMRRGGHTCFTADDGVDALLLLKNNPMDLMVLDIMMPHLDGFSVCKMAREMSSLPIILLTAKSDEEDKLKGYAYGADDYMTKPFSPKILLAKANALLRRTSVDFTNTVSDTLGNTLSAGKIMISPAAHKVFVDGTELTLTHKEYELLYFFLSNPEQIFSREQLLNRIWGYDFAGNTRTVDTHIKTLRQKLGSEGKSIVTLIRSGYKFEVAK